MSNGNKKAKEAMIEWMIGTMVSEEVVSEDKMEAFRQWLTDGSDEDVKAEGLRMAIETQSRQAFSRSDVEKRSEEARERWRMLALSLGLNPELNHYRALREARIQRQYPSKVRPMWIRVAMRVAAVLVPIVVIVGGLLMWERAKTTTAVPTPFVAQHTIAPHPDSVRRITLTDGTQVTLNRNSTLFYNDSREAKLSGEAYFKVAEDSLRPFVIHSDHVKVMVLGTEFNFRVKPSDSLSTLSLYRGRVELVSDAGIHLLEEGGREFLFDHTTGEAIIREFDTSTPPEWVANEDLYRFRSLGEIFRSIETEYGVELIYSEAIDTTQLLSFRLRRRTPLPVLMSVLKEASDDFDYTINGNKIILKSQK